MHSVIRYFVKPSEELETIEDKLYSEPTSLMNEDVDDIWKELFSFIVNHAHAIVSFDVYDMYGDPDIRGIKLKGVEILGLVYLLDENECEGVDVDVMHDVVYGYLHEHFSEEYMKDHKIFEVSEETLKRFNLM